MRRFIILGLVGVFILTVLAGGFGLRSRHSAHAQPTGHIDIIPGDVDGNGHINFTGDVITLAKMTFGLLPLPAPIVLPTDANGNLAVAEQNKDANGNIKVHEQGTVNVSVVSSSSPSGTIIPVITDGVTFPNGAVEGSADVRSCAHLDVFVSANPGPDLQTTVFESLDGATSFGLISFIPSSQYMNSGAGPRPNSGTLVFGGSGARSPYVVVHVSSGGFAGTTGVNVWLFCS